MEILNILLGKNFLGYFSGVFWSLDNKPIDIFVEFLREFLLDSYLGAYQQSFLCPRRWLIKPTNSLEVLSGPDLEMNSLSLVNYNFSSLDPMQFDSAYWTSKCAENPTQGSTIQISKFCNLVHCFFLTNIWLLVLVIQYVLLFSMLDQNAPTSLLNIFIVVVERSLKVEFHRQGRRLDRC